MMITSDMSMMQIFVNMAQGNPGAINALMQIYDEAPLIDTDSALLGLGPILTLDTAEIYGSDIWILFSDICGKESYKFIAVTRAVQLGLISKEWLKETLTPGASEQKYEIIDKLDEIVEKVIKELSGFDIEGAQK